MISFTHAHVVAVTDIVAEFACDIARIIVEMSTRCTIRAVYLTYSAVDVWALYHWKCNVIDSYHAHISVNHALA